MVLKWLLCMLSTMSLPCRNFIRLLQPWTRTLSAHMLMLYVSGGPFSSHVDETNFAHVLKLSGAWKQPLVSLSFWQDAVPYNWDRSESLEMYNWSLPGLSSHAERNMRFPIAVCPGHFATTDTHKAILKILAWSLTSLAEGIWPTQGPEGGAWKSPLDGPLGFVGACVEWKGDWKMMSSLIGLPMWNNRDGVLLEMPNPAGGCEACGIRCCLEATTA